MQKIKRDKARAERSFRYKHEKPIKSTTKDKLEQTV